MDNYSTAKSKHVQQQIAKGVSKEKARRSWSHGQNNPMQQWLALQPEKPLPPPTIWESNFLNYDDIG